MSKKTEIKEVKERGTKVYVAKLTLKLAVEESEGEDIIINGPEDVANLEFIKEDLIPADRECLFCLHLTIKHKVVSYEVVSIGSLNQSVVHPREVFKAAILFNASEIILAHNHPSGDPEPSPEDITVTSKLIEAGKTIGIEVLDHIIFGDRGFVSLKERGIL